MSSKGSANEKQQLLPYANNGKKVAAKFEVEEDEETDTASSGNTLVIAFVLMLFFQLGNRIFGRLSTYPMHNYPFFMNIMSIVIYVPLSFAYIWPVMYFTTNIITKEQREIPKYKFAVMGLYDSLAGIMQVFAVNYITNASTIVLVQQSAIPISMAISSITLKSVYTKYQYQGAAIVLLGIVVVLLPSFLDPPPAAAVDPSSPLPPAVSASTNMFWILVMVVSCVPMCMSSVYKEKALGETEIDVMYLNGWVAVFQLIVAIPLSIPSALVQGMPLDSILPNIYQGTLCWVGINSITADFNPYDMPLDDCSKSALYVNSYLFFNIAYNFLIILILKHGSANILFMASTVIVPLSNVAFSLHFMPGHQPLRFWDIIGLFVILLGLIMYRFYPDLQTLYEKLVVGKTKNTAEIEAEKRAEKIAKRTQKKQVKYVGINQMESLQSLMQTRVQRDQSRLLFKSPGQIRGNLLSKLGIPPSPMISLGAGGGGRHSFIDNRGSNNSPQLNNYQGGKLGYQAGSNFDPSSPSRLNQLGKKRVTMDGIDTNSKTAGNGGIAGLHSSNSGNNVMSSSFNPSSLLKDSMRAGGSGKPPVKGNANTEV